MALDHLEHDANKSIILAHVVLTTAVAKATAAGYGPEVVSSLTDAIALLDYVRQDVLYLAVA